MQMARWFGYRPGYRHLLRIWTTQGLYNWFIELEQVEQDLRAELIWMQQEGLSPSEYGPRIRVSPNMNITRAAAMRSVARSISYSDTRLDLAWLDLDRSALEQNQAAAARLAQLMGQRDVGVSPSKLFRSVSLEHVSEFILAYKFHEEEKRLDVPSLRKYLEQESESLATWNVLFKSLAASPSEHDFGGPVGVVKTVARARVTDASVALIQSVIDPADFRLDAAGTEPSGARYRATGEPPLLVVYGIDRLSEPRGGRVALNAEITPISFGLALPRSTSFVEYVAPRIAEIELAISNMDEENLNAD
jgi:hypothetical protein